MKIQIIKICEIEQKQYFTGKFIALSAYVKRKI